MDQLTKEQAIALYESNRWEAMSDVERAEFQLGQDLLCMPFGEFQRCMEVALGRPVWTHEFADRAALTAEMKGEKVAPTFEQILNVLPADKTVVVVEGSTGVPA